MSHPTLAHRPTTRLAPRRVPHKFSPVSAAPALKLQILSKWEILQLLEGDFLRECREIRACADYAERLSDVPEVAQEITERGQRAILHSFELAQIILQLGGTVPTEMDARAAAADVCEVSGRNWAEETLSRLRERASHLILLEEIGLSVRMFRLIKDKRNLATLESLVGAY